MFQHGVLIFNIHGAINPAFFTQRGVCKRSEVGFFTAVRHVQTVNDILTVEVVAEMNTDGKMVKQGEADILIFAATEFMVYLFI